MKRLRALAARASCGCRSALAVAGPASARVPASARRKRHALVVWTEDHAEPLILTTLLVLVAVIGTLLLWKTARVISLAAEFQPVLGVIAALTTISLATLNVLKGRRNRRTRESGRQQAPDPAATAVTAGQEAGFVPGPDEIRGSSPPLSEDARGSSG